ncbi:MAG: hypothetical protein methR_P1682 [Methyloprofundus sp.]|nr:MAG: hypothetical protein methR_P1682 [Methyloprofundus sp.]
MSAIRVLLVEDDLADQMSFKRFVKKNALHYDYTIAGSLADAITLLESNSYDIILADHSLGDGTAFDLFAHIAATPLIFITGNGTEQTAVKALKAGAADYLSKDIDANYLQLIPITIENVLKAQAIKVELTRYQVDLEALVEQRTQELETEIERRKKIETQLRLLAITFETHESIVITDAKAKIVKVNKAFSKLTGYSAKEVIGNKMSILKSGRQLPDFYKEMWKKLIATGEYEGELWNRSKSGRIYPEYLTITAVKDETGAVSNYVGILTDITLQKEAETEIKKLAFYDALTSLANRRLLYDRLEHEVAISKRTKYYGAIIFLDMDDFKPLNDTYGHHVGDELLIQVAQRLQGILRKQDTPSRFGGDEFVILIHASDMEYNLAISHAKFITQKIQYEINKVYYLDKIEHHCSCSMGFTMFPNAGLTTELIMQQADKAMYAAKHAGKNRICFYDKGEAILL